MALQLEMTLPRQLSESEQNYKLDTNQIPGLTEKITLRLNGQNIRERIGELKLDETNSEDQYSNLVSRLKILEAVLCPSNLTIEQSISRIECELGHLQTTLPLLSITGDQSLKYSLSITDIGDARADLLTEWGDQNEKKSTGT